MQVLSFWDFHNSMLDNLVKIIDFSASKVFRKELLSPVLKKMNSMRKSSSPLVPSYPGMMLTDTGKLFIIIVLRILRDPCLQSS